MSPPLTEFTMFRRLQKDQSVSTFPTTIAHADFADKVAKGDLAVVDVREPHEFASGHVPGAINLPLSAFHPALLPTDKPVALICAAGSRSASALAAAREDGRADVVHYAPGTNGWRMRGGAIER